MTATQTLVSTTVMSVAFKLVSLTCLFNFLVRPGAAQSNNTNSQIILNAETSSG